MRRNVIRGLSVSTIDFAHYLIDGKVFGENVIEHKMCVLIFSTTFVGNVSRSEEK
jgi:hypothetical protein